MTMSETHNPAAAQMDNSIQESPGRGRWRMVCLLLLVCVLGIAAWQRWRGGGHFDEEIASQTYEGMTTYYLNSSNHSNASILYLTDGENGNGITDHQWRLINRIASETDAEIIIPDINALSAAGDEAVYESLYAWYVPWQHGNSSRLFYIVGDQGDSALLTGFLNYLQAQDAHLPSGTASIDEITEILSAQ